MLFMEDSSLHRSYWLAHKNWYFSDFYFYLSIAIVMWTQTWMYIFATQLDYIRITYWVTFLRHLTFWLTTKLQKNKDFTYIGPDTATLFVFVRIKECRPGYSTKLGVGNKFSILGNYFCTQRTVVVVNLYKSLIMVFWILITDTFCTDRAVIQKDGCLWQRRYFPATCFIKIKILYARKRGVMSPSLHWQNKMV